MMIKPMAFVGTGVRGIALLMLMALAAACFSVAAEAATGTALVLQDQQPLRAAPRESAPAQAQLWRGEALELRGERLDYYQVWDYRRERGGWVRKNQLHVLGSAEQTLAVLGLVRQQVGAEALGLGLAAAYIQAASGAQLASAAGSMALDALGSQAERLADRASTGGLSKTGEAALAAHLEVAARYGLRFTSQQVDGGGQQLCYEGEAFRRLLALPAAAPEARARAALALSRPECQDGAATPREREQRDEWRAALLEQIEATTLPAHWKNRLLLRRASVWSSLAFARTRRGDGAAAQAAAERALAEFGGVLSAELAEEDAAARNEAAMRANAMRWAAQPRPALFERGALSLRSGPGAEAGETCLSLEESGRPAASPLARRCSWGQVWLASASLNREGSALAVAVQPLDGWRELWLFHRTAQGWQVAVLPPAAGGPGLGYAEFAGWVPGGRQLLVAREARVEGRYRRSFELLQIETLQTERQAGEADLLGAFQRWQDPVWKRASLSLR